MEKRSFSSIASPAKTEKDSSKKLKVSPKKTNENNANVMNAEELELRLLDDLCFDDEGMDDEFSSSGDEVQYLLDLSTFKRCVVQDIQYLAKFEKLLILREKNSKQTAQCCLTGPWFESPVKRGETVSIQAAWNSDRKIYQVSSDDGLLVVSPDTLISGTTVVGSLFCPRKSVIAERFKPLDTGDAVAMHIGSFVHEILQTVLKKNLTTLKEIQSVTEDFIKRLDSLQLMFNCKMTLESLRNELEPFTKKIHEFMRQYIVGDLNQDPPSKNLNFKPFNGRISEIQDIEENVWCPRLGLKGKVDVTVKVNPPNKFFDSFQKLMPLEIKTGKASFSLEHKGQLILYQMMMQDLGQKIDSGLLLYIREGIMGEVAANPSEKCGLIQMRNQLANYLTNDIVNGKGHVHLPEPIDHHSACGRCEYSTICCTFSDEKIPKAHVELIKQLETHLTPDHVDYFIKWCQIITQEHNEAQKSVKLRHIWTKPPEFRAAKGSAVINLKICDLVQPEGDEFIHKLSGVLGDSTVEAGEYLIVSTDKRCSVAAGRVLEVGDGKITLSLPRDLSRQYSNCNFHLDRYESSSQSIFNYSNIGALLNKEFLDLRKIVVDKIPTTFSPLPKSVVQKASNILKNLNPVQQRAVLKAISCDNYMLIKGLPGTGKTQTLVALIQLLVIMDQSIIITSHTNSAVDNILLRLVDRGLKFMRLGSSTRVNPSLRDYLESALVAKCKTLTELERLYEEQRIVATTCLGSSHAILARRKFDFCLVDEATQIFQPTVLRPIMSAKKFILVGDPKQLAPLVRSNASGADESLFERLDSQISTTTLGLQYRMNRVISKLANSLTYGGELKCANEAVEKATVEVMYPQVLQENVAQEKWLMKPLSLHIDQSCVLVNTGDVTKVETPFPPEKNVNFCEISIVLHIAEILIASGVSENSIGVIAPYRSQVETLKKVFSHHKTVEVNTVDQYQGRDKKIIIYSCTQSTEASKSSSDVEILEDRRRLTVAITRAKQKLIVIGDVNRLNSFTPFNDLFKYMNNVSKVQIEEGKLGFSWGSLLSKVKL